MNKEDKLNQLNQFFQNDEKNTVSTLKVDIETILNAYEQNNLFTLIELEKNPEFQKEFEMGLEYYFFLNNKFLNQGHDLIQFTVNYIKKINYELPNNDIINFMLTNENKKSQHIIFENFLLEKENWFNQEFKDTFQMIINHSNWKYYIELFSINDAFNEKIKTSSLNTLLLLANRLNLREQIQYFMEEKNLSWLSDKDNVIPSIKQVFKKSQTMVDTLKLVASLPKILIVPNVMATLEEIVHSFSIKESSKKEALDYLIDIEKQFLLENIQEPSNLNKAKKIKI